MLLTNLSPQERFVLTYQAEHVDVARGEPLVTQGDPAGDFYVLLDGFAGVFQDGRRLVELRPGDFFGEVGLLETGVRTASVIGSTDLRALVVRGRDFERLLAALPGAAEQIRRVSLRRLIGTG